MREQIAIHNLARKYKCDLILGFGSAALFYPPCPQIQMVQNRIYLSNEYLERVASFSRRRSLLIRIKGAFLRWSLRHSDLVITESEAMKSLICRKWRLPRSKITVLHMGFDTSTLSKSPSDMQRIDGSAVILCVGHFAVHKGLETLVVAADKLHRTGVRFSLRLAGDFDAHRWGDWLQAKAKAHFDALLGASGAKERFRFLGHLSHRELAIAYQQADICVFPSWCEAFPNPVVEALANAIPIVAADTDVNRELCGDAALYFPPEDPSALADRIGLLIRSPETRHSLSERAAERAQKFSWRRTTADLWSVFQRPLGEDKTPGTLSMSAYAK
jgi:glycosyltransferase involved in cell wall biosynthesis